VGRLGKFSADLPKERPRKFTPAASPDPSGLLLI
jgi:hypothetical protein